MNVSILSKKSRPLFERLDVLFEVSFDSGVPSRKDVRAALCAALSAPVEKILIVRLSTSYGVRKATGIARIYERAEDLAKDKKHLRIRDGLLAKEEKKAAEKKAAPAKK